MNVTDIARIAHEANRALCIAQGDHSQPGWDDAPGWQTESARAGVCFHMANPDALARASHEAWREQKLHDGWEYGPVKDPEKKTHPCMVDFEDLPPLQQAKDYLFKSICHALIPFLTE